MFFVGSGIFKSGDRRAVLRHCKSRHPLQEPALLAEISRNLGEPMVGRQISSIPDAELIAHRGGNPMKVGILALQGDFLEHQVVLKRLGVETTQVRLPRDLDGLQALIIPGGESTTIGKLAAAFDLMEPLRQFGQQHAIWGTCAGAIFLSKDARRPQPLLV